MKLVINIGYSAVIILMSITILRAISTQTYWISATATIILLIAVWYIIKLNIAINEIDE